LKIASHKSLNIEVYFLKPLPSCLLYQVIITERVKSLKHVTK